MVQRFDTSVKKLTIQVENHNLSYIDFEVIIPKGEYGAHSAEICDKGTYILEARIRSSLLLRVRG